MSEAPLVAIVDDDSSMREATSNFLQAAGLCTATFSDARSFLESARRRSAVVTDVRMPGITGFELHQKLVAFGQAIPTVLITAYLDDSVRARARTQGWCAASASRSRPTKLLGCVLNALAGGQHCSGETGGG